jgi:hypothetical protein
MNRLEDEVRDVLAHHAGPSEVRRMPPSVVGRVRAREALFVGKVAVVAAVALLAGLLVLRSLPGGSRPDPADDGFTSPLEDVPPGWPTVDVGDATLAYVLTLEGGSVVDGPFVIATGTVDGAPFSFYGWTDAEDGPCLGLLGPAVDDEALRGAAPAVVCAGSPPAVPADSDLVLAGTGGFGAPGLGADFGFVSDRVRGLRAGVQIGGPTEWTGLEVPLLERPEGWNVDPFLFFPPPGEGAVEAWAAGDTLVAHADLCAVGGATSCAPASVQDVPISADDPPRPVPPAPGRWPEVTFGGDFAPYVDHVIDENGVLDAEVVGEKVVVAYGTVQGVSWSLTAFNARGFDGSGEPVASGQIFLGSIGQFGGSDLGPSSARPGDLEVSGIGFGQLPAYVGLVSSRVASVELRSADGEVRPIDLFDGPPGVDARYFVVWTPNGIAGRIVALDETGTMIGEKALCLPAQMDADATTGC